MGLRVGDEAPNFTVPGVEAGRRRDFTLSEFRGQPVVLAFYPGDNTPVCTQQLNSYTTDAALFAEVNAQVLALSPEGLDSHEGFAEAQGGFAFPLLADEDRAVGELYGIIGALGLYKRSIFVIGGDGRIAWIHRALPGVAFRSTEQVIAAVKRADAPAA